MGGEREPGLLTSLALGSALGAAATLGFAPVSAAPLLLLPGALFWLMHRSPKRAAWLGYGYGLGHFGTGISWVWHSLHNYGNLSAPLAAAATALFCAGLALFFALLGLAYKWCAARSPQPSARRSLLLGLGIFPALFMAQEWLRANALTGLPWLELGVGAVSSPMAGWIPALGTPLTGWLLCVSATALALAARPGRPLSNGPGLRAALLAAAILPWAAGQALRGISWTAATGEPVKAAAVATDIPLRDKWGPEGIDRSLLALLDATPAAAGLVLWPEVSLPLGVAPQNPPPFLTRLRKLFESRGQVVVGGYIRVDGPDNSHNTLALLGRGRGHYDKEHLVPFGEYVPLGGALEPLLQWFDVPYSRLQPGQAGQEPLPSPLGALALAICYEVAFRDEFLRRARGADFLLGSSNTSWFGDGFAAAQMVQMARARALEAGRWLLYSANGGEAAVISPTGGVAARAGQGAARAFVERRVGRPWAARLPGWLSLLPLGFIAALFPRPPAWRIG